MDQGLEARATEFLFCQGTVRIKGYCGRLYRHAVFLPQFGSGIEIRFENEDIRRYRGKVGPDVGFQRLAARTPIGMENDEDFLAALPSRAGEGFRISEVSGFFPRRDGGVEMLLGALRCSGIRCPDGDSHFQQVLLEGTDIGFADEVGFRPLVRSREQRQSDDHEHDPERPAKRPRLVRERSDSRNELPTSEGDGQEHRRQTERIDEGIRHSLEKRNREHGREQEGIRRGTARKHRSQGSSREHGPERSGTHVSRPFEIES